MNKVSSNIWIVILALSATMLYSCGSSEYPDLKFTPDNDESLNKEVRGSITITPTLNYSTLFFASASRGSGAYDRTHFKEEFEKHYMESKFYVLAYRRSTAMGEMSVPADFTQLMNNNTNPDRKDCLLSTEKIQLGEDDQRGKVMMPVDFTGMLKYMDDETASREVSQYRWNEVYNTTGYDFFGYYYDDAKINKVNVLQDKTSLEVTFDGTQDLMVGMSPEVTEELLAEHYPGVVEQKTKDLIISYGEGAYSTYAAEHSVQPKIDLQHCLSRILVCCKQMDAKSNINIKEVKVKAKTSGVMTVAARKRTDVGFVPTGKYSWVSLPNVQVPLKYGENVILGNGVMIPEEKEYEIQIVFEETYFTDIEETQLERKTFTYPFTVKPEDDMFHAGTAYYIMLTMYGMTRVDVDVNTTDNWKDGGSVDIGTQD